MVSLANNTMVTELISYMDWIIYSTLLDYLIHGLDYNTVYYNFILANVMQHLPRGGWLDKEWLTKLSQCCVTVSCHLEIQYL